MTEHNMQKRRKGRETSARILEAAAELFAKRGYGSVPLREIAEAASIRESSLYNQFAGKQGILEALFKIFAELAPQARPSAEELDEMLLMMEPEEVFKAVLFHVGRHMSGLLENIFIVIENEKYSSQTAAAMHKRCLVEEPAGYYERLIERMAAREMIKSVDAQSIALQYCLISLTLTQEYFMAKNGFGDVRAVVERMVETLTFFCGLMKK